jgi:hypothetical protein
MSTETTVADANTNTDASVAANQNSEDASSNTDASLTTESNETSLAPEGKEGKQDDSGKEGESKAEAAPETYEAFKMPEGFEMHETTMQEFTDVAKGLKLSQESAQKLIDLATKNSQAVLDKQKEDWDGIRKEWVTEMKSDKEFGGGKLDETMERARRALRRFGSEGFKEYLGSSGMDVNPGLIRLLAKVDKAVGEDQTSATGQTTNTASKTHAQVIYPSM